MRQATRTLVMVGGPLDGQEVPDPGHYFKDGDLECVEYLRYAEPGSKWSKENIYRVAGNRLVFDAVETSKLNSTL